MKRLTCCFAALLLLCLCACGKGSVPDKTVVIMETKPSPDPTAEADVPAALSVSDTDWYGWWKMDRCKGDWSHMYGYYWDCCAVFSDAGGGAMELLLWDEDMPRGNCLSEARLEKKDGVWQCKGGSFLDRELGASDWKITESEDACGRLLSVEGEYKAVGKGGFHYVIYLRPWGSRWPGNADERPYYYESWYLPMIEKGMSMPDVIGGETPKGDKASWAA